MASASYFLFTPTKQIPTQKHSFLRGWLPLLVMLTAFCVESSAMMGANHTSAPLHAVAHSLSGARAMVDAQWSVIHHLIRKTGHFLGYGLLSMAWLRGLMLSLNRTWRSLDGAWRVQLAAVALTFAIAGLDELHQSFLPNRTGQFSDVLLDTCGAITLQLALRLGLGLIARIKARYASHLERLESAAA